MVKCKTSLINFLMLCVVSVTAWRCTPGDERKRIDVHDLEKRFYAGKGVGPVTDIELGPLDMEMASKGKTFFTAKCIACHRMTEQRVIGPGLSGVTKRRTPEWIMNQILNPIGMTQSDSLAKALLSIYLTQMVPMGVTREEARSILEYLRSADAGSGELSER